ncbi:helix-turn-helix transcriptional regulator [Variovorax sp. PCZ-1]|uniref:helix-turn-helix domain-containing protein n=1 Tax=Variovorax sp. PCZ-1 TaxID=2835533 RepID=UPI001BCCDDBE|nr:helix-turn-helix transcriptional regulator [Variovorax sp. PCZ-1]
MTENERWGKRLKQARLAKGLSQKQLGIKAKIHIDVASTRINRYEVGVHLPDLLTAKQLAKVLNVPVAFFYATDDETADFLFRYHRADDELREKVQRLLDEVPRPPEL